MFFLASMMVSQLMVGDLGAASPLQESGLQRPVAVHSFIERHCVACHEGDAAEGGLDLTLLNGELTDPGTFSRWVRIYDRVHDGEMPPRDAAEVKSSELNKFLTASRQWMKTHQEQSWGKLGRVQGRRLTNLQLERTLHDLLGIDIPLESLMPEEQRSAGFTTVADSQPMSHFQLQQHLRIVDLSLDEAFERAILPRGLFEKTFDAAGLARTNPQRRTREPELIDGYAVTWSSRLIFYGRLPATTARKDGWYRFTLRAKALKAPKDYGVWCTIRTGKCVSSAPLLTWVGAFEATDDVQEWTFETWLPAGEMLEIRPGDDTLKMGSFAGGQVGTGEGGPQEVPGVAIESLVMEEIHHGPDDQGIRQILFDDLPVKAAGKNWRDAVLVSNVPHADVERLLHRFAHVAFRRPVDHADVQPYVELAQAELKKGKGLLAAVRTGYRALLCSPRFLYFTENPGALDGHALASRLSYFLWNTLPDEELRELAASDELISSKVLRSQIRRMMADPKADSFVSDFAGQWLDLNLIDFTTPDRRLYPKFDVIVQQSMLLETEKYLQEMLDQNLSVALLIDSDHTFLNERLARYYGIDNVRGDKMQKVQLRPQDHRGGVLTHGSILKVTANGTTTSPVLRGVWVSERLLGTEIPPPPTNVPAIEPDIRGAKTIREMLAKHKSSTACASCHVKIDPPGFALENYDPAGQWRDTYPMFEGRRRVQGAPIDASFELPDGKPFRDINEFQQLISARKRQLAKNVVEKLVTYGTGMPTTFADRDDIEGIVTNTENANFGFRSMIEEVAMSDIFRTK